MGRLRLYPDNAARQRAYREREREKHPPAPVVVPDYFDQARDTDGRTLRSFVQDVVNDDGISVAFAAKQLKVGCKVIRACLLPPTATFPQANISTPTIVSVTKKMGRPRLWGSDKHRKHAHWMRHLARAYRWSGFWADDARRVDAMQTRREEIRAAIRTTLPLPAQGIGAGQRDLRPAA
jgi:hypothetical protein